MTHDSRLTTTPRVAATIVNWNGKELVLRLLRSLEAARGADVRIVVVDNASTDGSVEAVRGAFPEIEVIALPENVGYSAGINAGIERHVEWGPEYHWIFNNDVEVEPEALEFLIEAMKSDKRIGIAGPLILDHLTGEITHAGYRVNMWLGWMAEIGRPPRDSPYEVDSAFGCSNLIRAEAIEDVGLFDPAYNVYFDETDFNTRARRKGWKVVVAPGARVKHQESATMNRRILQKAWLLLKNLLMFELKNARPAQLAVFIPYYFLVHIPYFLIRGSFIALRTKFEAVRP